MRPKRYRKLAPRVVDGQVQRTDRWTQSPDYYTTPMSNPIIDRRKPGAGYRHLLRKRDIHKFIGLLPQWKELSVGLNAIVLAPGDAELYGYQVTGVVHICAWTRDLVQIVDRSFYEANLELFERLEVPVESVPQNGVRLRFTLAKAQAFQLLDVLLHELGHHHDQMNTRSRFEPSRGEPYAENYALEHGRLIWDRFANQFGLP